MSRKTNYITFKLIHLLVLIIIFAKFDYKVEARKPKVSLSACQHLRQAESRRARLLADKKYQIRIPKCANNGDFESIQCSDEVSGLNCWCVDEYGQPIPGTFKQNRDDINSCNVTDLCPASSCRMFCPSGFNRDPKSGCKICQCRDVCDGITCPGSMTCQPQEINCDTEPCPPIPSCRRSRSLDDFCPSGMPLMITNTTNPFLCGNDPGKPRCPPLFDCLVQPGNDYGVCCRAEVKYEKPGTCPSNTEYGSINCAVRCSHDLECPQMQKCCEHDACGREKYCQLPMNVTNCTQYKLLTDLLSLNDREGRGYVPNCDKISGMFNRKQCSRNGLVCWCVDPDTGKKIEGSMGAAALVTCDAISSKSAGRSLSMSQKCDQNICAAVCEYGFKNDHDDCPTCECSAPCDGYLCPIGFHCEVARDTKCSMDSALCATEPVCKPNIIYSNPCDVGTPLVNNVTEEVHYCSVEYNLEARELQTRSFYDAEIDTNRSGRKLSSCPPNYHCTKAHGEDLGVCCQQTAPPDFTPPIPAPRRQSMCEYLRDFSSKMIGTEKEMFLAIPAPICNPDGSYRAKQCTRPISVVKKQLQNLSKLFAISKVHTDDEFINEQNHGQQSEQRSAKIIDSDLSLNFERQFAKTIPSKLKSSSKSKYNVNEGFATNVPNECWCVDGFGTKIPGSEHNASDSFSCESLRESIGCLDITCRMGCDYGFVLDPSSKCPACECRDLCQNTLCPENYECRLVDVSCEGEYCPPVPACLLKKPGQCPFLVPMASTVTNTCEYECRSDSHCQENKKCCSNGCGTQCIEPQLKTACQHLQAIQYHQAIELGIPAKEKYIAQCDETTGKWKEIQCGPHNICWCVDQNGGEIPGTKTFNGTIPNCRVRRNDDDCPAVNFNENCEHGYAVDAMGCRTGCQHPCDQISCPSGEVCQLLKVYCIDEPCPKMPICVPQHESICTEGHPLQKDGNVVICGPNFEQCPSTHSCQLNVTSRQGVCCGKTRDVCFESISSSCERAEAGSNSTNQLAIWHFSPKLNKCLYRKVNENCNTKNAFHSESACTTVCPTLTSCERLRIRNEVAAKHTGYLTSWFQPRCDPENGSWLPVQCLGTTIEENEVSRTTQDKVDLKVCWCVDKKGAPIKGSLTRSEEPTCNFRQARRKSMPSKDKIMDPVIEELIKQMTIIGNNIDDDTADIDDDSFEEYTTAIATVKGKLFNTNDTTSGPKSETHVKPLIIDTTRCLSLQKTTPFSVVCDNSGGFNATQCNAEFCWCVDEAGNQLPSSNTFKYNDEKVEVCPFTPIESVFIKLHLVNSNGVSFPNLNETIKNELKIILGEVPMNLHINQSQVDKNILVSFELVDDKKVDKTFALEEIIKENKFQLGNGELRPDITLSKFIHHSSYLPTPQRSRSTVSAAAATVNTFQTIIFVLATTSAFLISILVVFIMLKRGKSKLRNYETNKTAPSNLSGDKFLDYSAPIFVLSPNDKETEWAIK